MAEVSLEERRILRELKGRGEQLQPTVIKIGGSVGVEEDTLKRVAALRKNGVPVALVHGGGPAINQVLARRAIKTEWIDGQRVTDGRTLNTVVEVLDGINEQIVGRLRLLGIDPIGYDSFSDLLRARRVDSLGFVGEFSGINNYGLDGLWDYLRSGIVPVIAPITNQDGNRGQLLNTNADLAAAGVARELGANLILVTDTEGVKGRNGKILPRMDGIWYQVLREQGIIEKGMIPKMEAALAVAQEDHQANICPADRLVEVSAGRPVGTLVVDSLVRRATLKDIGPITELIQGFADKNLMLPRPADEINPRNYFVYRDPEENSLIGCAALQEMGDGVAELRAVAVREGYRKKGAARALVRTCLDDAATRRFSRVFLLTLEEEVFKQLGFTTAGIEAIPDTKLLGECFRCPRAPYSQCNEVAMIREIDTFSWKNGMDINYHLNGKVVRLFRKVDD